MFFEKGVLNLCSKFTGEHPGQAKCDSNFIEITVPYGWSPVNLLHILRTLFPKNTSGWLLLKNLTTIRKKCKNNKFIWYLYNFSRVVATSELFQINKTRCFFTFNESWRKINEVNSKNNFWMFIEIINKNKVKLNPQRLKKVNYSRNQN